jgi:hypothetical protein
MTNVLHWIGVAFGLLVVAGGIRLFVRGLIGQAERSFDARARELAVVVDRRLAPPHLSG